MSGPEANIQRRIIAYLKTRQGSVTLKLHGGPFQRAGEPDVLYLERGRLFCFESKSENGEPTRLQLHRLDKWRRAGAEFAGVVRSVDEVRAVVEASDTNG